ncbi:MAG: MATE family efflux transporter [Tabrizicola sp.]|jgi:MATE family multidrug resistance protein|nr:MATE family efflux transporter [Tabrizicola sp.]
MTYSHALASQNATPHRHARRFDEARAMLRLAFPIMLIALLNMGMSITDTIMVSTAFGPQALAAVAVGSDFYSILFYLGAGTLGGLAPFYAAANANGDTPAQFRLQRVGQVIALLLAVVLVPVVWTAPDWLRAFGLDNRLLDEGRGYTQAMAGTLLPMLGVVLYRTILTAAQRPGTFLKVTAAMLPLNALGNLVMMHGFGPIPAFGPTGAGLSTLIVASISLVILIVVARRSVPASATPTPIPRWADIAPVLRVGLPIGVATLGELGIFLAATLYAATLGADEVAAHTLTLRIAGVAYAVPAALLQATMVRMARAEAVGDSDQRARVTRTALWLSAGAGAVLLIALSTGAGSLSQFVLGANAAGTVAASLLMVLGIMEFTGSPGLGAAGLLRGRKDTRTPMLYTLSGYWLIGVPVGLWLCESHELGIIGIWAGLAAGTTATSVLMLVRLARSREQGGRKT